MEDSDKEDESGEEEFAVDSIINHAFEHGVLKYEVVWVGYPNPTDHTWEPPENLDGCPDELAAYHKSIGGTPIANKEKDKTKSSKKRKMDNGDTDHGTPQRTTKARKPIDQMYRPGTITSNGGDTFVAPAGDWTPHITRVTIVYRDDDKKNLRAEIQWNSANGMHKSTHQIAVLHEKAPQKVCVLPLASEPSLRSYTNAAVYSSSNFTKPILSSREKTASQLMKTKTTSRYFKTRLQLVTWTTTKTPL